MKNLKLEGQIEHAIFAIFLNDNDFAEGEEIDKKMQLEQSNIIIGGNDLQKYSHESEFQFFNVINKQGFWEIPLFSVKFSSLII